MVTLSLHGSWVLPTSVDLAHEKDHTCGLSKGITYLLVSNQRMVSFQLCLAGKATAQLSLQARRTSAAARAGGQRPATERRFWRGRTALFFKRNEELCKI